MTNPMIAIVSILVLLAFSPLTLEATAKPRRPDGGSCDSTGTERREGKDESGQAMDCEWDSCTFTECTTTGGRVGNCVKKTTYSNPRDCKAVNANAPGSTLPSLPPNRALESTPRKRLPRATPGTVQR